VSQDTVLPWSPDLRWPEPDQWGNEIVSLEGRPGNFTTRFYIVGGPTLMEILKEFWESKRDKRVEESFNHTFRVNPLRLQFACKDFPPVVGPMYLEFEIDEAIMPGDHSLYLNAWCINQKVRLRVEFPCDQDNSRFHTKPTGIVFPENVWRWPAEERKILERRRWRQGVRHGKTSSC